MDNLSKRDRYKNMSNIRSRDTKPEILIRKALFHKGFRYQLYKKELKGRPDLVFKKYKSIIFINGCFWHGHNCSKFKLPETNIDYWKQKIEKNKIRDIENIRSLKYDGWRVLVVWECSLYKHDWVSYPNQLVENISEWIQN